jgi:hypothetical protein
LARSRWDWGVFTSKEKTFSENITILVGILAAFGFSGYDIYFFVTDQPRPSS